MKIVVKLGTRINNDSAYCRKNRINGDIPPLESNIVQEMHAPVREAWN
jgi:hypothetical protein